MGETEQALGEQVEVEMLAGLAIRPSQPEQACQRGKLEADLDRQFAGTPAGDAFIAAWQSSGRIIRRGVGPQAETPALLQAN